jgi:hypothetical protein
LNDERKNDKPDEDLVEEPDEEFLYGFEWYESLLIVVLIALFVASCLCLTVTRNVLDNDQAMFAGLVILTDVLGYFRKRLTPIW